MKETNQSQTSVPVLVKQLRVACAIHKEAQERAKLAKENARQAKARFKQAKKAAKQAKKVAKKAKVAVLAAETEFKEAKAKAVKLAKRNKKAAKQEALRAKSSGKVKFTGKSSSPAKPARKPDLAKGMTAPLHKISRIRKAVMRLPGEAATGITSNVAQP